MTLFVHRGQSTEVLAGGLAGVLGASLMAWTDGNWIVLGLYMATLAAITTASTFLVPETRGRDLLRTEDAIRLSTTEKDSAYEAEAAVVPGSGAADETSSPARA